ncbi:hypothetical protein KI387_037908, partial [Taxus chinensis]
SEKVNSGQLVNIGPIALRHVAKGKRELFVGFRSPVFDERKNGAREQEAQLLLRRGARPPCGL